MKIAMLGHKRVPSREGGVEVAVGALSEELAKLNVQVTLYNRSRKGQPRMSEYKGMRIVTVPTVETKNLDATVYSYIASILAVRDRQDIVHYHALGPAVSLLIPRLFGIKTVVTVHGLNYKTPKWKGLGARYIKLGERIAAKYADSVIVLSENARTYFENTYGRETVLIGNGVEEGDIKAPNLITSSYGLSPNGFILAVSRLVPGKGLECLIAAYKKTNITIPLVIAGDSEYMADYKQSLFDLASEGPTIQFLGQVDENALDELYSNAALFVLPSEAEGMPMCLLEAMAHDCPCLVSDIPENVEVLSGFGCTFETNNEDDLARMLKNCLVNQKRTSVRDYIRENYSWNLIAKKTLDLYKSIY